MSSLLSRVSKTWSENKKRRIKCDKVKLMSLLLLSLNFFFISATIVFRKIGIFLQLHKALRTMHHGSRGVDGNNVSLNIFVADAW